MVEQVEALIESIAARVGPAVVGVGHGSGVVVAPGQVLTAAHTARREQPEVSFADGSRQAGDTVAVDLGLDLALLRVRTDGVEPLTWPEGPKQIRVGNAVLALANPGGRGLRVTLGFVSCATATPGSLRGRRIGPAIEHTAPLPRGSSGGPLLDSDGTLIGINAVRMDAGLILAIPVNPEARRRLHALEQGRRTGPVRLGVAVAPARVARRLRASVGLPDRDGVLVRAVEGESPAARAGLQRGDLIVSVGGRPARVIDDLYETLDALTPGDALELMVVRGVEELVLSASL